MYYIGEHYGTTVVIGQVAMAGIESGMAADAVQLGRPSSNCTLTWSLDPLFNWLACLGLDVQWSSPNSEFRRTLVRFTCPFWLLVNTGAMTYWIGQEIRKTSQQKLQANVIVNDVINIATNLAKMVALHLVSVSAARWRARGLGGAFEKLEIQLQFSQRHLDRIRRVSITAVSAILIMVALIN